MSCESSPAKNWRSPIAPITIFNPVTKEYGFGTPTFNKLKHSKGIRDHYKIDKNPEAPIKTSITVFDSQPEVLPQAAK